MIWICYVVMPGLVPGIPSRKTWSWTTGIAGTCPATTQTRAPRMTEQTGGRIFFSNTGRTFGDEDELCLLSVGVDIGSSTSHLVFSRVVLERLDSRYVVTEQESFYQSDILLTPYSAEVNEGVRRYLNAHGVHVAAFGTFNKRSDLEYARISPASIADGVRRIARSTALDAVFVSCTSLRLTEIVAELEADIGIPVTSSDHAMAWHCLRLGGVKDTVPGVGRLFTL